MIAPTIFIGAVSKHLSEHKDLQQQLRENPDQIPSAVEEFVRLYTPYRSFARSAKDPVEIAGQKVVPGEPLAMTYSAANRDPDQFPNPDQFILDRENISSHLGFGRGRHRCAGMPLARLAMQIFVRVLLKNTTDFEVVGPLDHARMPGKTE
jgi:cytochrome P450